MISFRRLLSGWIVVLPLQLAWPTQGAAGDRTIRLGRAQFEPKEGSYVAGIARDEPFVVQF